MTTARASITNLDPAQPGLLKKILVFLLFFVVESMVFAIMPLSGFLPMTPLLIMQAVLLAILLVVTSWLRRSESGRPYWPVYYAFFVGGLAVLVSTIFSDSLMALFGATLANPQGIAIAKFSESLLRVAVILLMTAIVRADWRSIYLQKGRLGLGLAIGIPGFIVLAAWGLLPIAGQPGGVNTLLSLLPWILLFILSNAFMEELLFRGIFLKRYEPFLGKGLSLWLVTITFTLLHFQAGYVLNALLFLVQLFPFALIWGWLMQKTDSLLGSVLFHAGADCIIIYSIFKMMDAI
jgi:membrane protease YdiL (CAAX protease family)